MPFTLRPLQGNAISVRSDHLPDLSVDYDSESSTDTESPPHRASHSRRSYFSGITSLAVPAPPDYLLPSSACTTATSTPLPSRPTSPLPQFTRALLSSRSSSTFGSDTDEPTSPLLRIRGRKPKWWGAQRRRWWGPDVETRRVRRRDTRIACMGRWLKRIVRFRFFPSQPTTILLTLLLFTLFAIALTVILIHTLNPDKEPLPWRAYCSMPPPPRSPPSLSAPTVDTFDFDSSYIPPPFPPVGLDSRPPAGILLGVFTTDHAVERRMLIRSTWARHVRSRNGAGAGDDGRGTSRTIIKFILGRPRSKWERRVQLEMETYNDIVILPITENMNDGKTHAFFSWASTSAWVPPPAQNSTRYLFSYSNSTSPPPPLSLHDPRSEASARPWVRPDYIVKSDDDSFVMLAELEARLRLELSDAAGASRPYFDPDASPVVTQDPNVIPVYQDPLVYWGYLVKNRFMAGELYALSWSLVDWLSNDATVKGMTRGAEDKQVAKWMRLHPRANEVRWASERCWIYDHPRAATVYSHGFLFPSEVTRVRRNIKSLLQSILYDAAYTVSNTFSNLHAVTLPDANMASSQSFSYSTVSAFRTRYSPPLPNLTPLQSVEALVEGSAMSLVRDSVALGGADAAWRKREGRRRRYEGKRVGGTTVVHFIKRNEWFLETALALLEGDEVVEAERHREAREDEENLQEEEEEEEEVEDEVISDDEDDDTVSAALDVESIRSVDEDDRGDGQPVNTFASHSSPKHAASRRKR